MSLSSGSRFGVYEIVGPLGAGGTGEVYRARDTKLGREVAIKILPESFAQDSERLARFEREAKLLAALNHPGIATLYGLEESNGSPFLVMELVEGETLAERIARGATVSGISNSVMWTVTAISTSFSLMGGPVNDEPWKRRSGCRATAKSSTTFSRNYCFRHTFPLTGYGAFGKLTNCSTGACSLKTR